MQPLSLLVIAGDKEFSQLVQQCLQDDADASYNGFDASSLRAARELMEHHDFDVVLLDLDTPQCRGVDAVRIVVNAVPEGAVVLLSDREADDHLGALSISYGAHDYLEKKHLSPASLKKSIEYARGKKQYLQEKQDLLSDLNYALEKIGMLERCLPLCRGCSRILDAEHTWRRLDTFTGEISVNGAGNHMCPTCRANER